MTKLPEIDASECGFAKELLRQHVAHSMGLAVQGAVENLRNVTIIANAATAAALAELVNGNDASRAKEALIEAREAVSSAEAHLKAVTAAAAAIFIGVAGQDKDAAVAAGAAA